MGNPRRPGRMARTVPRLPDKAGSMNVGPRTGKVQGPDRVVRVVAGPRQRTLPYRQARGGNLNRNGAISCTRIFGRRGLRGRAAGTDVRTCDDLWVTMPS